MSSIYRIGVNGETTSIERIRCDNEDTQLQAILEKNPDLLPGDQIDPEDPRRWLLIKREMPVPDPSTASDRWSIDFLYADQDAIPTFVECKRYNDTRSRREVIGQMIEYAANGHYYWTKELLRDYAEKSAINKGSSLDESFDILRSNNTDTIDGYFERIQENLREAQLRIIFFLEESPYELKSAVDFLNSQMERSEVLLVEARQYRINDMDIVAPMLFGYTEEARQIKRSVNVKTSSSRRKWNIDLFLAEAEHHLTTEEVNNLQALYEYCLDKGFDVTWGTGAVNGTFNIKHLEICPRSILTVSSDGSLIFNFGWLDGDATRQDAKQNLLEQILLPLMVDVPDDYESKFPTYPADSWIPKVEIIKKGLINILSSSGLD
jgi:hypothetical protein